MISPLDRLSHLDPVQFEIIALGLLLAVVVLICALVLGLVRRLSLTLHRRRALRCWRELMRLQAKEWKKNRSVMERDLRHPAERQREEYRRSHPNA